MNHISAVTQSCLTLCDPMDCSMPGFPVHQQPLMLKLCPLSRWCHSTISSSCQPLLLLPSIFPGIRVFSSDSVLHIRWPQYWGFRFSSVLPMNIQDWFPLGLTGLISLLSKGFSRVFSTTTVQKHQFFGTQLSLWSNSHIHIWLLEKP